MNEQAAQRSGWKVNRPKFTATGLAVLWGSVAIGVIGVLRYDSGLIWLGMLGMLVLGVAGWLAPRNLQGLEISRDRPSRVFAGESFELHLKAERPTDSNGWLPRLGIAVEIRDEWLPRRKAGVFLERGLAKGESAEGKLVLRIYRRGTETRRGCEILSRYPLGLFELRARGVLCDRRSPMDGGLTVYPQPFLPEALKRDLELTRFDQGSRHGIEPEAGEDFRGIREYRSGDPVKAIHWPATSRSRRLMVREWDPPAPRPARYGLLLHTWEEGSGRLLRPDRWEMCLRVTTGLVAYCRESGIGVWFADESSPKPKPMLRIPESAGFSSALKQLALARRVRVSEIGRVRDSLERLAKTCDRVFVVSDVPLERWSSLINGCPNSYRIVCVDTETVFPVRRKVGVIPEAMAK